jgi:hypothetical protein
LIHRFDWDESKSHLTNKDVENPFSANVTQNDNAECRSRIRWMLGQKPEKIDWDGIYTFLTDDEEEIMGHDRWKLPNTESIPVSFGENVRGNI